MRRDNVLCRIFLVGFFGLDRAQNTTFLLLIQAVKSTNVNLSVS